MKVEDEYPVFVYLGRGEGEGFRRADRVVLTEIHSVDAAAVARSRVLSLQRVRSGAGAGRGNNADDLAATIKHQRHCIRRTESVKCVAVQKEMSELVDRDVHLLSSLNFRARFKYLEIDIHTRSNVSFLQHSC